MNSRRLRKSSRKPSANYRLATEQLEDRRMMATFVVNNLNAFGLGSLLRAVVQANGNPGPDDIVFESSLSGTMSTQFVASIGDSVNIVGPGSDRVTIDMQGFDRAFHINEQPSDIEVAISGLKIVNANAPQFESGGAIFSREKLTLRDVTISDSESVHGGAVAVVDADLTVEDSTFVSNTATEDGGALLVSFGTATISNSRFIDNSATSNGMAVFGSSSDIDVSDSTFEGNFDAGTLGQGGAIQVGLGSLDVTRSTFQGNSTRLGGAIFSSSSDVTIDSSSFVGNSSSEDGGALNVSGGSLSVLNSTLSGNSSGEDGGAISSRAADTFIRLSTITQNVADSDGDGTGLGGGLSTNNTVIMSDTILSGNLQGTEAKDDLSGPFDALNAEHSLLGSSVSTNGVNNIFTDDPMLGRLINNGGPTQTHALRPGSPAINAASPIFPQGVPDFDQRGKPRLVGARMDIGAFESGNVTSRIVSIAHDESDGDFSDGDLSLREAIELSNESADVGVVGFDSSLHNQPLVVENSRIPIVYDMLIAGPNPDLIEITGQNATQLFRIDDGDADHKIAVAFEGVTISGGRPSTDNISGGAISSRENLTIRDSRLTGNSSTSAGGAVRQFDGNLRVEESEFSNNFSDKYSGGAISFTGGEMTIVGSTFEGNAAGVLPGFETIGGAVAFNSAGELLISHSTMSGNTAEGDGGGLHVRNAANVEILNSTFFENSSTGATFEDGDSRGDLSRLECQEEVLA
ncbi:MAG: choice-of-anchor Q domain-containing protein [Planctomycetota bacterium]